MNPQVEAAIIAAIATLVGVGGTVLVALRGFRSTKQATEATIRAQREQLDRTEVRTLHERFATAAGQLGNDKPPQVRLAGVYAMTGLADDWEENRQTCVDVLCGYLRMPYEPDPGQDTFEPQQLAFRASREVRHTVIRVIAAHLRDGAAVSWQGLEFDFWGVIFDGGDFRGAEFSGSQSVAIFDGAEFSAGEVRFDGVKFSGGEVWFGDAKFSGGTVRFDGAEFSGGMVSFRRADFFGSTVRFDGAKFSGAKVGFLGAEFSRGTVDFGAAKFSGGTVDFGAAKFSGGTVDFSEPGDWSSPPAFPWTDTPPPGVKLPKNEDQSQA